MSQRLISLDFFRGLTIAAMIVVNDPGSWTYIFDPLRHAQWNGVTPTDLVFPFFLFIVGVSIVFSLSKIKKSNIDYQRKGTYVVMEGPQFSTLAESELYRNWGCDVVGMTNMPEAKLAKEAEMCYVSVAMVTDYDCWHTEHENVSVDAMIKVLNDNADNARSLVNSASSVILAPSSKVLAPLPVFLK